MNYLDELTNSYRLVLLQLKNRNVEEVWHILRKYILEEITLRKKITQIINPMSGIESVDNIKNEIIFDNFGVLSNFRFQLLEKISDVIVDDWGLETNVKKSVDYYLDKLSEFKNSNNVIIEHLYQECYYIFKDSADIGTKKLNGWLLDIYDGHELNVQKPIYQE